MRIRRNAVFQKIIRSVGVARASQRSASKNTNLFHVVTCTRKERIESCDIHCVSENERFRSLWKIVFILFLKSWSSHFIFFQHGFLRSRLVWMCGSASCDSLRRTGVPNYTYRWSASRVLAWKFMLLFDDIPILFSLLRIFVVSKLHDEVDAQKCAVLTPAWWCLGWIRMNPYRRNPCQYGDFIATTGRIWWKLIK